MTELLTSIETVEKTQRWTIKRFSLLNHAVEQFTESPEFEAAGRQWRFQVYPGGKNEGCKDLVSLYLSLVDAERKPLRTKFELAIINAAGERFNVKASPGYTEFGLTAGPMCGFRNFIPRNQLLDETKGFMLNDAVTFEVKMTVIGASQQQSGTDGRGRKFEQNTLKAIGRLFESGLQSDVTLVVDGEQIPAHKPILAARSPVFEAMFAHKMSESLEGKVMIDDMPLGVFRELLRYAPVCLAVAALHVETC